MRKRIPELKTLVDSTITALVEHEQADLVIEMAEHYFKTYVKEMKDIDDFLFKISAYAFEHGAEDRRYYFIIEVIKFTGEGGQSLIHILADAYKQKGKYLNAYLYYVAGDKPLDVVCLLHDHVMKEGYESEENYFILRAILEFILHGNIDSAKIVQKEMWSAENEDTPLLWF
jgi:Pyruvate/2-oxoacid:ferredoxin oxidoreductase gamma subunit